MTSYSAGHPTAKGVQGMAHSRFRQALSWRYRRFVQRQGYVIITILCAAIIVGSAAWTQQAGFRRLTPAPTGDVAAADLWQQSLREAATPTPAPTEAPALWQSPVAELTVLQGFDTQRLTPTGIVGLWRVHDMLHIDAYRDETITSVHDGAILQVTTPGPFGASVLVDHGEGYVAEYAGLSETAELQPGQHVRTGEAIGYAGFDGLRLRVTLEGVPIDPMGLLAPSQP